MEITNTATLFFRTFISGKVTLNWWLYFFFFFSRRKTLLIRNSKGSKAGKGNIVYFIDGELKQADLLVVHH